VGDGKVGGFNYIQHEKVADAGIGRRGDAWDGGMSKDSNFIENWHREEKDERRWTLKPLETENG